MAAAAARCRFAGGGPGRCCGCCCGGGCCCGRGCCCGVAPTLFLTFFLAFFLWPWPLPRFPRGMLAALLHAAKPN